MEAKNVAFKVLPLDGSKTLVKAAKTPLEAKKNNTGQNGGVLGYLYVCIAIDVVRLK